MSKRRLAWWVLGSVVSVAALVGTHSNGAVNRIRAIRNPEEAATQEKPSVAQERSSTAPDGHRCEKEGYRASVTTNAFSFDADGVWFRLGAARAEQGGVREGGAEGRIEGGADRLRIDRGAFVEEYLCADERVEQLFHFARPLGSGALTVRMTVDTNLVTEIVTVRPDEAGWKETPMECGGILFRDDRACVAYHTAVAIDAQGARQPLSPRYEDGEIVLEVPAAFMNVAQYPVVVDPWIELESSATNGGLSKTPMNVSSNPCVAVDGEGHEAVAYADNGEIYVRRRMKTIYGAYVWLGYKDSHKDGGISKTPVVSKNPHMAIHPPTGLPWVVWNESGTVRLLRFYNGSWMEMNESNTGEGLGTCDTYHRPMIAFSPEGSPAVTRIIEEKLYVVMLVGTQWKTQFVSGTNTNAGSIACSPNGTFMTAVEWEEEWSGYPISIWASKYDAAAQDWVVYSNPVSGDDVGAAPSIAFGPNNVPYISYTRIVDGSPIQRSLRVKKLSGDSWVAVGGSVGNAGPYGHSSLKVDSLNRPVVAWVNDAEEIHLKKFISGSWTQIENSATGGGISSNSGLSRYPHLFLGAGDQMLVVWQDDTSGNWEIYLKKWFKLTFF